ncbi:MAG: AzlD domain-containing protein [Firmicutes bacterium]|nr:AzlD domain-containing protein [Bacillota bacterium]
MTNFQILLTILILALGTLLTRALPFLIFPAGKKTPVFVKRLQVLLPSAAIGLLLVYCLRNVELLHGSHGLPEGIAVLVTAGVHLWRKNSLLSIGLGTACYMILVQLVFQ